MNPSTRKKAISYFMPKMVFCALTVADVTTIAGYFLASELGLITLNPSIDYWISAVLAIVSVMFVLGLGFLRSIIMPS
jgi:hypothetical protein